ncbi:MFS transporter [Gordonia soli]|uniref:MFS transporter n=1 Tax=Gordonia soli TaxID=320799 RepID=UPI002480EECB|nr:MFS transporter [Gordonia soli]
MTVAPTTTFRRWSILACSLLAAMATTCVVSGVAFLIPELQRGGHISLAHASLLASAPMVGLMLTTVAWGWALDRRGERRILLISLGATVVCTAAIVAAAATGQDFGVIGALLLVAGAAAASTNGASGRIVVGWFPPEQRGTAMGVRQMAQPLGVGVCAMTVPSASQHFGVASGFAVFLIVAVLALIATAVAIVDPPTAESGVSTQTSSGATSPVSRNPYRGNRFLVRVHAVSVLLVIPQMILWTFVPVWLIVDRGWSAPAAGALVTVTQVVGALGRIAAGRWSDVWRSRMKPIRVIAVAAGLTTGLLALTDLIDSPVAIAVMVVASVVTVADNGLAFTAIAEYAGPSWSGRGLAIQNTAQYLAGSAAVPIIGATISAVGYPAAFAIAAIAPVVAAPLVPRDRSASD